MRLIDKLYRNNNAEQTIVSHFNRPVVNTEELLKASIQESLEKSETKEEFEKAFSGDLQKRFPNGKWVTINGSHVFINGGKVIAGLGGFNKEIDKFFEGKKGGNKLNLKDLKVGKELNMTFKTPDGKERNVKIEKKNDGWYTQYNLDSKTQDNEFKEQELQKLIDSGKYKLSKEKQSKQEGKKEGDNKGKENKERYFTPELNKLFGEKRAKEELFRDRARKKLSDLGFKYIHETENGNIIINKKDGNLSKLYENYVNTESVDNKIIITPSEFENIVKIKDQPKETKQEGNKKDDFYKNMPKKVAEETAQYWGQKKMDWNSGKTKMSKEDQAKLKEVQQGIDKYHPELNKHLSVQEAKKEDKQGKGKLLKDKNKADTQSIVYKEAEQFNKKKLSNENPEHIKSLYVAASTIDPKYLSKETKGKMDQLIEDIYVNSYVENDKPLYESTNLKDSLNVLSKESVKMDKKGEYVIDQKTVDNIQDFIVSALKEQANRKTTEKKNYKLF